MRNSRKENGSPIGSHFDRLRNLMPYHMRLRKEIGLLIEEVCNITLQKDQIKIISSRVYITTTPEKKAVITKHEDIIIRKLEERIEVSSKIRIS
jgi:hypothetical protein